jgi:GntR family transcriptional regulator
VPEVPDYWRIADEIVADVRSGQLKPEDMLPSIADTRAHYGVSHGTVQMAYGEGRLRHRPEDLDA